MTISRTGDLSDAVALGYSTSDSSSLTDCHVLSGNASSRCDYATSIGRTGFGPGQTSAVIYIPIVDDAYAEGSEAFSITLNSPFGGNLGARQNATLVIQDNDTVNGVNSIDGADFLIRQNYIDFLGREPDPAGLAGWRNVLNNCGTSVALPCDRIEVSAGFSPAVHRLPWPRT